MWVSTFVFQIFSANDFLKSDTKDSYVLEEEESSKYMKLTLESYVEENGNPVAPRINLDIECCYGKLHLFIEIP